MMSASVRPRGALMLAASVAVVAGLAACTSGASADASTVRIVAYSTPQPAYDALEAAFAKTADGRDVKFSASYDSSGSQSKAVESGQPADYVAFSLEPDMTRLVPEFVAPDWNAGPTHGIVSQSVVVLVVRKGNPLHITGWSDLTKPGVKIVTPDPASSGSAKWNILAAYQHVISTGGTPQQAEHYLTELFQNVVSKPSSGSDAMTTFTKGTGDVLLSYEDEAIRARAQGQPVDYIVPNEDLLIQNPAAVTRTSSAASREFLHYVVSLPGQQIFASQGFRPALPGVHVSTVKGANDPSNPFPQPDKLSTIAQMGGWATVDDKFFGDPNGIVTKIEAANP